MLKSPSFRPALALITSASLFSLSSRAEGFVEDFSVAPNASNWHVFGNSNLFHWNVTNQNLEVTWDSSQPNSYFYRPLGTILTKSDDFSFSFDLRVTDTSPGFNPEKPGPFQLSVALLNLDRATQTNFLRGSGIDSPEVAEFSFFPDPGGAWIYGPSLTSVLIDSTGTNWSTGGYAGQALAPEDLYHVVLAYTASNQTLRTTITQDGLDFGQVSTTHLTTNFLNFGLNTLSICSYSDAGQDPAFAGSLRAHGTLDNIAVTTPPPPVRHVAGGPVTGGWEVHFLSSSNWLYVLERTGNFDSWLASSAPVPGNGADLSLQDSASPSAKAFYRVRAQRP